ncbi:MAG: cell division protein FtsA [bacterium]|nr:cell division protein FtsA [bacterium]
MKNRTDLIVGIDVGTTKICTIVAEAGGASEGLRVIGVGRVPSRGLQKGVVTDMDAAVAAITASVEDAEKMADAEIYTVFTGITGGHIASFNSRGVSAVADGSGITARDIERAIDAARAVSLPADREVLHTIPIEFAVDGQAGIRDPKGMTGVRLEAEAHIVTGAITAAQNIIRGVNGAGFEVEDIVLQALASSVAVLDDDARGAGVLLIDLGGGTTDAAVFHRGAVRHSHVLAVGGDHVTNDISVALRIPVPAAEEIKRERGCAIAERVDPEEEFEIPASAGRMPLRCRRRDLARVIGLRMEETLTLVRRQVERSGLLGLLGAGVVLTGGGALTDGAAELAERIFRLPARVGRPSGLAGVTEVIDGPDYAAAAGLVIYGRRGRLTGKVSRFRKVGRIERIAGRLRAWIGGRF